MGGTLSLRQRRRRLVPYRRWGRTLSMLEDAAMDVPFDHHHPDNDNDNNDIDIDIDIDTTNTVAGSHLEDMTTTTRHRPEDGAAKVSSSSSSSPSSRFFLQGDELHRLRRRVLDMQHDLVRARRQHQTGQIQQLTTAIVTAQAMDGEYSYARHTHHMRQAQVEGRTDDAQVHQFQAAHARASLPQFQLSGLWVGKYQDTFQLINVTYHGDILTAYKITSGRRQSSGSSGNMDDDEDDDTTHVPRGEITFRVDLTPPPVVTSFRSSTSTSTSDHHDQHRSYSSYDTAKEEPHHHHPAPYYHHHGGGGEEEPSYPSSSPPPVPYLEPIQLTTAAAIAQWGTQYLQRHGGVGQVAAAGYRHAQFVEGQLILVSPYISFVWIPTGHQVFFGRPSAELILQLLRPHHDDSSEPYDATTMTNINRSMPTTTQQQRQYLERCYEETELLDDEMEVSDTIFTSHDPYEYYQQSGCFE
jgi:hypothetical protein